MSLPQDRGRITMDAPKRTRSCRRQPPAASTAPPRGARQICLPMDRQTYDRIWDDAPAVRRLVQDTLARHPELFPEPMTRGFTLCGKLPPSKKLAGIRLRRVRVATIDEHGRATTADFFLRPSFVLPYCCGTVDDVEKGMLLLSYDVPYHVVAACLGRNA